jgi:hypothetical protein
MPKWLQKDLLPTYGFPFGEPCWMAEEAEWQRAWYNTCYREAAIEATGHSYGTRANLRSPILGAMERAMNNMPGGMKNFVEKLLIRALPNMDFNSLLVHLSDPNNEWPKPAWIDAKQHITNSIRKYLSCDEVDMFTRLQDESDNDNSDEEDEEQRFANVRGY